jgi:ribosomal protein L29
LNRRLFKTNLAGAPTISKSPSDQNFDNLTYKPRWYDDAHPCGFPSRKISDPVMQSNNARVKAGTLWGKGKDDLKKQLDDLKTELGSLRVQKIAGGASSKLTRMYVALPRSAPSRQETNPSSIEGTTGL